MESFSYSRPSSLKRLADVVSEDCVFLAGGTDLLVQMKSKLKNPASVISLRDLEELKDIKGDGTISIGALVTHREVSESKLLQEKAPLLVEAAGSVGSPQIRNRGTIGGNIANASPAADTVPALVALGAEVEVANGSDIKKIALEDLFLGPGKTVLRNGELIKTIYFSELKDNQAGAFIKLGKRDALAISVVNVGVVIGIDKNEMKFTDARIALGSVAPTVIRIKEAEDALVGEKIDRETVQKAAALVRENVKPITDIRSTAEYRKEMSEKVTLRAVYRALKSLGISL